MIARFALISVLAFCVALPLNPAQAGLLQFLFPSLRDRSSDPTETMQAPFAVDQNAAAQGEGQVVEPADLENQNTLIALSLPHMADIDVAKWVTRVVSDSIMFEGDVAAKKQELAIYFDAGGMSQYEAFLKAQKIDTVIASNRSDVMGFVNDEPLLLNKGAVNDRYRWLYEVPLTVSYIQRGVRDYKAVEAVTQNYKLQIQLGRSGEAEKDSGLQLERWSGEKTTN